MITKTMVLMRLSYKESFSYKFFSVSSSMNGTVCIRCWYVISFSLLCITADGYDACVIMFEWSEVNRYYVAIKECTRSRNGEITYLVRRKISNCAVNAYVKLRPTKPGSMVSRDKTENIAVNKIIRLAHDSSLKNDKNISRNIFLILLIHIFISLISYLLHIVY